MASNEMASLFFLTDVDVLQDGARRNVQGEEKPNIHFFPVGIINKCSAVALQPNKISVFEFYSTSFRGQRGFLGNENMAKTERSI